MPADTTPPHDSPPFGSPARPSSEERMWAMVAHVSGVVSSAIVPIVVPLIIYLAKKDESEFVADQAKEALNFHITVALAACVVYLSFLCFIGPFILPLLFLASLVFAIVGSIKAYDGQRYRYPFTLRVIA